MGPDLIIQRFEDICQKELLDLMDEKCSSSFHKNETSADGASNEAS